MTLSLSSRSAQLIINVYNSMNTRYPHYIFSLNKEDIAGSVSIEISNRDRILNKYYFYPSGINSNIGSITLYGDHLLKHYDTINNTKNIFGFRVKSIELVSQNTASSFLDIFLDEY